MPRSDISVPGVFDHHHPRACTCTSMMLAPTSTAGPPRTARRCTRRCTASTSCPHRATSTPLCPSLAAGGSSTRRRCPATLLSRLSVLLAAILPLACRSAALLPLIFLLGISSPPAVCLLSACSTTHRMSWLASLQAQATQALNTVKADLAEFGQSLREDTEEVVRAGCLPSTTSATRGLGAALCCVAHLTAEGFGRGLSVGCGRWQVETVKREAPRVSDKVVNEHVPVLQKKVRSLHHWPRAGPSSREHQQTHV